MDLNVCRCCEAKAPSKNLITKYNWMGELELYSNMIEECFSIKLETSVEYNGICELCISQLRTALKFKKQIENTDKKFWNNLNSNLNINPLDEVTSMIKLEVTKEETLSDIEDEEEEDNDNTELMEHDGDDQEYFIVSAVSEKTEESDDDYIIKYKEEKPKISKMKTNVSKSKVTKAKATKSVAKTNSKTQASTKVNIPIKKTSKTPEQAIEPLNSSAIGAVTQSGKPRTQQTDPKPPEQIKTSVKISMLTKSGTRDKRRKKEPRQKATPERIEHRVNLSAILQFSNATPFKDKTARGFCCLYCSKYFQNIDEFRIHTSIQSEKDKLNSIVDYKLSYHPIKLDITNLMCKLCPLPMKNLAELKEHLISTHNKLIYKDIKDTILPFRLEDGSNFVCEICTVKHVSFKNLYQHMSSHYSNYCCQECGVGYITLGALKKHSKTHEQGNFPCRMCSKTYASASKRKHHEKGVHGDGWQKRNKCPYCPETFVSYYDKSDHIAKVHNGESITFPCNACNKVYKRQFELSRHIHHHHLQQRNFDCQECSASFFTQKGLNYHKDTHTEGEIWTCDVCGKQFVRERSLQEHIKTHSDFPRYHCEVCTKSFTQKSSLKCHMKLHQTDLDIFNEFVDVKHLVDDRELTLKQVADESKRKVREQEREDDAHLLLLK